MEEGQYFTQVIKILKTKNNVRYLADIDKKLQKKKVENIEELLRFIPAPYQPFYNDISTLGGESGSESEVDTDSESVSK